MVNILKIFFSWREGIDIRRIPATVALLSEFSTLQQKIRSLFQLSNTDDIIISWTDDEDDSIRITCDEELAQARIETEEKKQDMLCLFVSDKAGNFKKEMPHPANVSQVPHPQVVCDNCDKEISGFRYKCLECPDYDLCSGCNASNAHPTHDMVKLTRPAYIARKWIFQGAPRMWKSMFQPSINRFYKCHFQGNDGGAKTKPGAEKPQCSSTKPQSMELFEELFGKVDETTVKTVADLPEVLKGILPAPAIQLFHDGLAQFKNLLEDVVKENTTPRSEQAPSTSTSAQTKTETPVAADQSTQVEASSSGNVETGTSPAETTPMDIGSNQMPTEVEDAECVDEIIVDPENGTTQTQEQPKLPEDWTLLDADISSSSRMDCGTTSCGEAVPKPTQKVVYPNLVDVVDPAPKPQENPNYIRSRDPKIRSAVMTMNGMGFSNEGGWLETLLISKNGNINETLESLYPTMR